MKKRYIFVTIIPLLILSKHQIASIPVWLNDNEVKKWFKNSCNNNFVREGCSYKNSYIKG